MANRQNQTIKPTKENLLVPLFSAIFSTVLWMSKAFPFQMVNQILVILVLHLFYEKRFLSMEHFSPRDTQLPSGMLLVFITMSYTCLFTDVVYHGGTAWYKKKFKTLHTSSLIK